ncbi:hypothetical protein KFE80_07400 [bacterium SCSIO 12696]|nr:hypothetical protein KFE80_07400 [bacterium SCSIO 12696]
MKEVEGRNLFTYIFWVSAPSLFAFFLLEKYVGFYVTILVVIILNIASSKLIFNKFLGLKETFLLRCIFLCSITNVIFFGFIFFYDISAKNSIVLMLVLLAKYALDYWYLSKYLIVLKE